MGPTSQVQDPEQGDRDERLGEAIEVYLGLVEEGSHPDPDTFIAGYPDLAEELSEALEGLALVHGLVGRSEGRGARLEAGRRVAGYRIVRELGRGGMGVVYEAVHVDLDRPVALKVLGTHAAPDSDGRRRFLNEAKTAAGLHHTHIVPVFDVGQVGGLCYYAMQRIEGCGLDRVLKRMRHDRINASGSVSGPRHRIKSTLAATHESLAPATSEGLTLSVSRLDELSTSVGRSRDAQGVGPRNDEPQFQPPRGSAYFRWVADIGKQAAQALAYAHARGVVHRDVKPSNLLLDLSGTAWVADFGLARREEDLDLSQSGGGRLGTPRYMSPEQADGRPLDARTDIYSLGATLYELLTLRPPFEGKTAAELARLIVGREPVPPRKDEPRVPRDLETIVLKAMSKRLEDRYETAQDLADDLIRFLRFEPVRARRISPVGRVWRLARRHPASSAITVAATAVVLTIAGWSYARILAERDLARTAEQDKERQRVAAEVARIDAQKALARQYLSDAALVRLTPAPDRRQRGLKLLHEALAVESDPDFRHEARNQALELLGLRDISPRRELFTAHVSGLAFLDDGELLATLSADGLELRVWDPAGEVLGQAETFDAGTNEPPQADPSPRPFGMSSLPRLAATLNDVAVLRPGGRGVRFFSKRDGLGSSRDLDFPAGHVAAALYASGLGDRLATREMGRTAEGAEPRWRVPLWRTDNAVAPLAYLEEDEPTVASRPQGRGADFGRSFDPQPLVAFSPDGATIATTSRVGDSTVIALWSASNGKPLRDAKGKPRRIDTKNLVFALALGPGGLVATSGGGGLQLWDGNGLAALARLGTHLGPIRHLRFGQDGMLAVAGPAQGVELWDTSANTLIALLSTPEGVDDLAFVDRPGRGRLLAAASGTKTLVWEASEPVGVRRLSGFEGPLFSLAFGPRGELVVPAWNQRPMRLWGPCEGVFADREVSGIVDGLALFTASGRLLTIDARSGTLSLFDDPDSPAKRRVRLPRPAAFGPGPPFVLSSLTADRRALALVRGPELMIWSEDQERSVSVFPLPSFRPTGPPEGFLDDENPENSEENPVNLRPRPPAPPDPVWRRVALASDREHAYLIRSDNTAHAYAFRENRPESLDWRLPSDVIQLALSPDGLVLALATRGGEVVRVDTASGIETARFLVADDDDGDGITAMAFTHEGRLAVGTRQGSVQVWTVPRAGRPRHQFRLPGHQAVVTCLAFDQSGRRLASGGEDRAVVIWDLSAIEEGLERIGLGQTHSVPSPNTRTSP